jgi:hypothetical protein
LLIEWLNIHGELEVFELWPTPPAEGAQDVE